jgi:hypothetical protein
MGLHGLTLLVSISTLLLRASCSEEQRRRMRFGADTGFAHEPLSPVRHPELPPSKDIHAFNGGMVR